MGSNSRSNAYRLSAPTLEPCLSPFMLFSKYSLILYTRAASSHDSLTYASQATGISGVCQCQHSSLHVLLQLFNASCNRSVSYWPCIFCRVNLIFPFEESWNSAYLQISKKVSLQRSELLNKTALPIIAKAKFSMLFFKTRAWPGHNNLFHNDDPNFP
jgi:hypothetical protein